MTRHEFIRELILKLQSEARKGERFTWIWTTNKSVQFTFDEDTELANVDFIERIEYTAFQIFPGVPIRLEHENRTDNTKAAGGRILRIDEQGHLWPLNE